MDSLALLSVKLRKLLRYRGRSLEEADDLIQEAFLRLQEYRRERPVQNPEAFLVRTAINLATDAMRGHQTQSRRCVQAGDTLDTLQVIDPNPTPDEVLAAQQRLQQVRAGLLALTPRTREVFVLHRIEGYSHAQVSKQLGISISAVEKHVARAALFLLEWMAEK